ncbi:MAG: hypothetical protein MHMPM18_001443 [Marteilia pararefringens]
MLLQPKVQNTNLSIIWSRFQMQLTQLLLCNFLFILLCVLEISGATGELEGYDLVVDEDIYCGACDNNRFAADRNDKYRKTPGRQYLRGEDDI